MSARRIRAPKTERSSHCCGSLAHECCVIRELLNDERKLVLTSDRWHVIHSEWTGGPGTPRFLRKIVSEHDDGASALESARQLKAELVAKMRMAKAKKRAAEARDQVLVKRPNAESLENAGRIPRKR
jgi:hypothetical protein